MEIRTIEEIINDATAFYYFYLPVLAPSCPPYSLHVLSEAREHLNMMGTYKGKTDAQNIFLSQVGILARTRENTGAQGWQSRKVVWDERQGRAMRRYSEHVREMRGTREFLDSLMDQDCCSCTLRCMPDPEPSPPAHNNV